jgi:hypothetical protein
MAINIPIITSLEDTGIKNAKAAFNDFKSAVSNAEGGMGKFKAGSNAALDAVKANAGNLALAGGAALVAFAAQGIKAFQNLALAAGKFSDATGLAVEDASRYMEVAGDLAIPVDAVSTAIGRLNKTIGADPDKVRKLGVDLVYLADGSLDVNETFLNTIDRIKGIKDPAEKATVAAQLLGKGWQGMSELIGMGADDLRRSLNSVSGQQVIDADELKKAKEFRDAMDQLADIAKRAALDFGAFLVPVIVDLIGYFDNLTSKVENAYGWLERQVDKLPLIDVIDEASDSTDRFSDVVEQGSFSLDKFVAVVGGPPVYFNSFKTGVDDITEALVNADTAWKVLTGNLDEEVALDNAKEKLKDLEAAAKRAFGSGAQADIDAYDQAAADFVASLSAISGAMGDISSKEILIRYKTQGPAAALELANYLARGAEYGGKSAEDALTLAGISTLPRRAMGGPVMSGTTYLVGERGPELFTPSSSGNITPNGAMGGNTITVNVNGGDPNQIVAALRKYISTNGTLPLAVR